ncbi:MAG: LysR family transcriptional regulator [Proteobacteria bacterium]|nr:LysR family transcriptional regulator [Pseudomonadota bacterium]
MINHASALDIDAVRAFTLVADLASFTRAAQAVGMTQSAISLKLKRLEDRLGLKLVERTPRSVRLTEHGVSFLMRARDLLAAHDLALSPRDAAVRRLTIGFSDHVAGADLTPLLARIAGFDSALRLDVRIGLSGDLVDAFDAGKLDAVVVRRERHRRGGETLADDAFGWFAAPGYRQPPGEPLRLAMLAAPCGVRQHAIRTLDKAKVAWAEAFTGGGVTAVAAAVEARLAIAPLARRIAPPGLIDIGPDLKLPSLGKSAVVLYARTADARASALLRTLAATFRGMSGRVVSR